MTRHLAGTKVVGGYYWNPKSWGFEAISGDEGVLTGAGQYVRIPGIAVIPAMVLMSFAFVVFMPFIGFAMAAWALAGGAVALTRRATRSLAGTLAPAWRPGMAWFAGKAEPTTPKKDEQPDLPQADTLQDLEQEIETRRAEEEKKP